MGKFLLVLVAGFFVVVLVSPVFASVSPSTPAWLGAKFIGEDEYYGIEVYAYETGDKAVLSVRVRNDESFNINLTSVYVMFDWGATYNSTQVNATDPFELKSGDARVFFIEFQVPEVSDASNLYTHSYTLIATYSYPNATDPSETLTDYYEFFGDEFAVLAPDQAEAIDLSREIEQYFPSSPSAWDSARARILWNKAWKEIKAGEEFYKQGDFTTAKNHYTTAKDYIDQAWTAEETYLSLDEELDIQEIQARIRGYEAMSNFFNGLSTMWMLFGIGGVLFGIGYILKWLAHMRIRKAEA